MSVDAKGDGGSASSGHLSPKSQVHLVYFLVVLYAVCYQLQSPLEPFLVDSLVGKDKSSESTASYARLQSFFGVIQMVGSLSIGNLLDRWGARAGFVINFIACAASYALLANTSSLTILYLSKVPGVAMAGFLCAQTTVSQLTPSGEERVIALGRLTTAYTVGGVVGPYTGGLLGAKGDYFLSAKIAAVVSLFAAALSMLLPVASSAPPSATSATTASVTEKTPKEGQPWSERAAVVFKLAGFLIMVKLVSSTANSMSSSAQSVILKNDLGFTEADLGFFMSSQFAFGGFANGFLLAPVTKLMGGNSRAVVSNCVLTMALGYYAQAVLRSESLGILSAMPAMFQTYTFMGLAMFLSIFQYSLGTSITAESTKIVPEDMKGTLIGMEHCIFSAARILTPTIGISILNNAGVSVLYATCASIFLSVAGAWVALAGRFLPPQHEKGS
mmetsp:Transcript_22629/g.63235  ORF Transcript_22629/g.63235 Transcript_22629/m.63235 type:complete len:444 (+) Transcript_22629:152-1483(+)